MKFITESEALEKYGPPESPDTQIAGIIRLARFKKSDVFYDLGSGYGNLILAAAKKTSIKYAVGIEKLPDRYLESLRRLRKARGYSKRAFFWCTPFEKYDFSDATVIYHGLPPDVRDFRLYLNKLGRKSVRIIRPYLPLVGFRALMMDAMEGCNFYVMQWPLGPFKVVRKSTWAKHVLQKNSAKIYDVYDYYRSKLSDPNRCLNDDEINNALRRLQYMVHRLLRE